MSDSEEETHEKQLKLVFLGDQGVGKTSIIKRFCYEDYTRQYTQTIGADFYIKRLNLPGKNDVTLKISDVSGGVVLNGPMLKNYLYKANMVILVYDITSNNSFENIKIWIRSVAEAVENTVTCAVFGNKSDLEHRRAISLLTSKKFILDNQLYGFLVSAKTGESVNSSVTELIAKHFGISLSRVDKEKQNHILKAELIVPIIEKYTENTRFCIICNYLGQIIPALHSRCTRFRFGPLSPALIRPRLQHVIDQEGVKISEDGKEALETLANGDMRKVLNVLQSTWLAYKDVTEDTVYTCVGHPLKSDIENIVKWLLNDSFKKSYKNIKELKTIKGLALSDILTEVHKYVHRIEFPFQVLTKLLVDLAAIESNLAAGSNENIQLTAFIAAFQPAREISPPE
ncbi:unnamed protein product [Brassicogethes aeneus]|uniref:Activator 1 subunit 5 n=1 Tax=Brassicogethes aeneus TaxID=1431903 RepID=A0A9P0FQB6_BRAAE|nr:unnamed protein product [Brassicogethes aeneus]